MNADNELTEISKHLLANGLVTTLRYRDGSLDKLLVKNYFIMNWPEIHAIWDAKGSEAYQKILVAGRLYPVAGESIEKRLLFKYSNNDRIDFHDCLLIEGYAQVMVSLNSDKNLIFVRRNDIVCARHYKNPGDAYLFCLDELQTVLRNNPCLYSCIKGNQLYPLVNKK